MMGFFRKGFLCGVVLMSFLFVNSCAKKVFEPEFIVVRPSLISNAPEDCYSMHFADQQNGLMRCRFAIWKTTNGGLSWHQTIATNTFGDLISVHYPNKDTAFFITEANNSPNRCTVYRSIDGGETWTARMLMGENFIASFYNGKNGYGFGELPPSSVYALQSTTNAASSWSTQPGIVPAGAYNMQFINSSTGIAQSYTQLFNTFDGGLTWNNVSTATNYYKVEMYSDGVVFRADDNFNIYKSTDFGSTWRMVYENHSRYYVSEIKYSSSGFCCAAYGGNLLISRDGGETWKGSIEIAEEHEGLLEGILIGSIHILNDHSIVVQARDFSAYNYIMLRIDIE